MLIKLTHFFTSFSKRLCLVIWYAAIKNKSRAILKTYLQYFSTRFIQYTVCIMQIVGYKGNRFFKLRVLFKQKGEIDL